MMNLIKSDDLLEMKLSFSESPQVGEFNDQLGDTTNVTKLKIDCSIDYVEIESALIVDYCNRVITQLAPQLEQLVFRFCIKGYEVDISAKAGDTHRAEDEDLICIKGYKTEISEESDWTQIIVDARDRWMKELARLSDSFQHLSKLNHLCFILSADGDIHYSFYDGVSDFDFLYIYQPDFVFKLLELENIRATLRSLKLKFDYTDQMSDEMCESMTAWLSNENTLMKKLSIDSVDGFHLKCPSAACYVEKLTLRYEDCLMETVEFESQVEILNKFPKLSKLNFSLLATRTPLCKETYIDSLRFIASGVDSKKGLKKANLTGDFLKLKLEEKKRSYSIFQHSEVKSNEEDADVNMVRNPNNKF